LRLASLIGVACFVFELILGTYAVVLRINGTAVSGFTTVIMLQLIIGSAMFFSVGILGEYIARIYEEVKHRPRYVVSVVTSPDTTGRFGSGDGVRTEQPT